jgi:hypothetical protein
MSTTQKDGSLADDMLDGAEEIAAFLGETPRGVYHLAATKRLPVLRFGRRIKARKSTILAYLTRLENGEAA